jgi:PadR family transcriptional regulator, regulatory protein PadR
MAQKEPRMSHQTLRVLKQFDAPSIKLAGSDIAKLTGMLSGTIYPILMRLERANWLCSEWEEIEPRNAGRPRRRLYRLTGLGYNKSRAAFSELGMSQEQVAWNF